MNDQPIHPATFLERLYPFLCGLFFLGPAIIMTLIAGGLIFMSFTEQSSLRNWVTVPAIVEQSQVIQQSSGNGEVSIVYNYEFHGQKFHAECYEQFNCHELMDVTKAEDVINQYPIGGTITVHVDPQRPDHAFMTATMNSIFLTCISILFFMTGLLFTGYCLSLLWRSVTAVCIIRKGDKLSNHANTRFFFYNSLEAAQKASEWSPLPDFPLKPSHVNERIVPFLVGLMFASIGGVGIALLIMFHNRLPGTVFIYGCIVAPMFVLLGTVAMRSAITAKYILVRKSPFDGQEEISFLNSQDIPPTTKY